MGKKFKAMAAGAPESQLASAIKQSAAQIWLAGLGAFAKAQEEGGKVFEALVKEGGALHARTRKMTGHKVSEVSEKVGKVADDLSRQASGTWDRLEQVFEARVARSLARLGVPTKAELATLQKHVEELSAALGLTPARKRPSAARRKARPAAKKRATPAKKPRTARKTAPR